MVDVFNKNVLYNTSMPHIHDNYDFVTAVFIVNKNKLLLAEHPRYGMWFPIGGHIELTEDPEEALYREVQEETGLTVSFLSKKPETGDTTTKLLLTPQYMDVTKAGDVHKHIGLVYFATTENESFIKSDEHTNMRWFSKEDIGSGEFKIPKLAIFYALEALKIYSN